MSIALDRARLSRAFGSLAIDLLVVLSTFWILGSFGLICGLAACLICHFDALADCFGPKLEAPRKPIQLGKAVCYGLDPRWLELPIENLPADAVRVRRIARPGRVTRVLVDRPGELLIGNLCPASNRLDESRALRALWQSRHTLTPAA